MKNSMKKFFIIMFYTSIINASFDGNYTFQLESATQIEIDAIGSPKEGMMIFNTTDNKAYDYNGTTWIQHNWTISTDANNTVEIGSDNGLYVGSTVYTGFFIISSSGDQNITGLPFQPSQINFVAHANIDSDNATGNNDRGIDNSFGTMNGFARDDSGSTTQQVIYIGGNGNSINDISRYASSSNCIGVRYGNQNGDDLGKITASLSTFNSNGFTVNIIYTNGTITVNNADPLQDVQPTDILNEGLVVLYTAYK